MMTGITYYINIPGIGSGGDSVAVIGTKEYKIKKELYFVEL